MLNGCDVQLISSDWEKIFEGKEEFLEYKKNFKISFLYSKQKKMTECPNPKCDVNFFFFFLIYFFSYLLFYFFLESCHKIWIAT